MPIHDWTLVTAGTWHDFHLAWIAELRNVLNGGLLPSGYYAQAEQFAGPYGADVLTLQRASLSEPVQSYASAERKGDEPLSLATDPPRTRITAESEMVDYVLKRRTLVIRHASGDHVVALLEIVSPGNKSGQHAFNSFVEKVIEALYRGYHLLIIDLFPPGPRDPAGIHGAIWSELSGEAFTPPPGEPLTLAAYSAGSPKRAFVEPTAVGRSLIDLPLFLTDEAYVLVPLESTYNGTYRGVPKHLRTVLESKR